MVVVLHLPFKLPPKAPVGRISLLRAQATDGRSRNSPSIHFQSGSQGFPIAHVFASSRGWKRSSVVARLGVRGGDAPPPPPHNPFPLPFLLSPFSPPALEMKRKIFDKKRHKTICLDQGKTLREIKRSCRLSHHSTAQLSAVEVHLEVLHRGHTGLNGHLLSRASTVKRIRE